MAWEGLYVFTVFVSQEVPKWMCRYHECYAGGAEVHARLSQVFSG